MKKIRMNAQGRVQGVGFRYMTKMLADQLDIKGIVKNEADGSVSIEARGDDEKIDTFIERIRKSPSPAGKVTKLEVWADDSIPEYEHFSVTY